jgi:lycopene cyclase domain-containing protein
MTYFGFLLRFLGIPIAVLAVVAYLDARRGRVIPPNLRQWPLVAAIALHILVALIYTTPWDNYLVATGVWYYDPALVTGLTLGWVPIEEYTFFVVQTILAGLWILFLLRRLRLDGPFKPLNSRWRWEPALFFFPIWAASVTASSRYAPGTYLRLELAWALLPIIIQVGFGGDILRRYGRLVVLSILGMTAYLSAADYVAIGSGTWAISSGKSLNILIGGVLPLEEIVFFLLTNTLITFGVVLLISQEGQARVRELWNRLRPGRTSATQVGSSVSGERRTRSGR